MMTCIENMQGDILLTETRTEGLNATVHKRVRMGCVVDKLCASSWWFGKKVGLVVEVVRNSRGFNSEMAKCCNATAWNGVPRKQERIGKNPAWNFTWCFVSGVGMRRIRSFDYLQWVRTRTKYITNAAYHTVQSWRMQLYSAIWLKKQNEQLLMSIGGHLQERIRQ